MEPGNSPKKRNIFNLIIGLAFVGYGTYRLFTYFRGTEYSTFRLVISVGFVILGIYDLYKFYRAGRTE